MAKRDKKVPVAEISSPFVHRPFAQLSANREDLPPGPVAVAEEVAPVASPKGPARAVVRMERKGRGGKEVTVVEQLGVSASELDKWLKALKQSLGCGGTVEEGVLVLQGDQRERLPALLTAKGVRKVSVG